MSLRKQLPLVAKLTNCTALSQLMPWPQALIYTCDRSQDTMLGGNKDIFMDHVEHFYLNPFRWPRTLAGIRAYLPCNRLPSSAGAYSGSSGEEQRAWRYCDREGQWAEEDYSRCQFQKDVTRFLYVINQVCNCLIAFNCSFCCPQLHICPFHLHFSSSFF